MLKVSSEASGWQHQVLGLLDSYEMGCRQAGSMKKMGLLPAGGSRMLWLYSSSQPQQVCRRMSADGGEHIFSFESLRSGVSAVCDSGSNSAVCKAQHPDITGRESCATVDALPGPKPLQNCQTEVHGRGGAHAGGRTRALAGRAGTPVYVINLPRSACPVNKICLPRQASASYAGTPCWNA